MRAFPALLLFGFHLSAQCISDWNYPVDGSWETPANWTSCIPGHIGDSATFGEIPGFTGPLTVTVGAAHSLSDLIFDNDDTTPAYILSGPGSLTLQTLLSDISGTHQIQIPLQLNNTTLTVAIQELIALQNSLSDLPLSNSSIQFFGPGELSLLNNPDGITIGGTLTANSGTINNENDNPVSSGQGGWIKANDLAIVSGAILNNNTGAVSTLDSKGVEMYVDQDLTINSGVLECVNTGAIGLGCWGSYIRVVNDVNMSGGVLILDNFGDVTDGYGVNMDLGGNFNLENGTVHLLNTGQEFGIFPAGSSLAVFKKITMNGGVIENGVSGTHSFIITPQIDVNGGELMNNSLIRADRININANGLVAGSNGTFTATSLAPSAIVVNNGVIIPGEPFLGGTPSFLKIFGSMQQSSSGSYFVNIQDASSFSQLIISDSATIDGSLKIGFTPDFDIAPGQSFDILNAANGVSGTFSDLSAPPFFIPDIEYYPDFVLVSFFPALFNYPGGSADIAVYIHQSK